MSLFLTGSCNVRVRRKISHGAIVRLNVVTGACDLDIQVVSPTDPRLMSAKDYAYIYIYIIIYIYIYLHA